MDPIGLEDISKMKVAELKKQLKLKGLAVTGNKNELVERLQEAYEADGMTGLDSSAGGLEEEDFDEEEILGEGEVDDLSKITPQEEAAVLGGIQEKNNSLLEQPEVKKISLKRSEPCLSTPAETTEAEKSEEVEDKENSLTEPIEPKHKAIKLSEGDLATPEDRAKKFGTVTTPESGDAKSQRAARFGSTDSETKTTNSKPGKLSMETGGTDIDKLKKRAERFGVVTSKSLSKLETLEKLKQRESRFGQPASEVTKSDSTKTTIKINSDTKKETRAERFGATKTNGASTDADDAKAKRAQRFAV